MKRRFVIFLLAVLICGLVPQNNIAAEKKEDSEKKITVEDLKTLTPEAVLEIANQDIEELYGLKNFFPQKAYGERLILPCCNSKLMRRLKPLRNLQVLILYMVLVTVQRLPIKEKS
ncbi:hypothetical protein RE628_05930 [Paenibacillus sp. D2_2]|uniref:hypothetical protein n=1 Tax=Paenibacillus sp. D2_2 TaxID=3073092 RepID=UPI0028167C2E|nr:hypothetical protein [Paenibacillus sp. D2_2]WMT41976.1 hypothetical protein RE628_05930 [Paenibacillus sp. D2_2]